MQEFRRMSSTHCQREGSVAEVRADVDLRRVASDAENLQFAETITQTEQT